MKRKISFCKKCPRYSEWQTIDKGVMGYACRKGMTGIPFNKRVGLGIYGDDYVTITVKKEDFEDLDVNDDCIFYTEYCMAEWNKRKK